MHNRPYQEDEDPERPRVLVLLNPFGGAGAARRNWTTVVPMMSKAHINYELRETEYA